MFRPEEIHNLKVEAAKLLAVGPVRVTSRDVLMYRGLDTSAQSCKLVEPGALVVVAGEPLLSGRVKVVADLNGSMVHGFVEPEFLESF